MIPWVNLFLWCAFFGILAFFTYYELQETSRNLVERQIIPGNRDDVFKILLDPEKLSKFHPLGFGVKDIEKIYEDDDSEVITEIKYTLREKLSLLGYFERVLSNRVTLVVVEPNTLIEFYGIAEGIVHLKGNFTLNEYKGKDHKGTVVVERVTITTHRALMNFVLGEATVAQRTMLKNLRNHFLKQDPLR